MHLKSGQTFPKLRLNALMLPYSTYLARMTILSVVTDIKRKFSLLSGCSL